MYPEMHTEIVPNGGWDDRIHLFRLGRLVTCFAIACERYVVLLDTLINPPTARELHAALRPLLADRQLLVVNTHADWDHCWGNSVFAAASAPIIAHRICRERLLSDAARAELHEMQAQAPATFADVQLQPPTLTFDGAFTIDGGDLTFVFVPTPGHQPDHLSIWIPEIRTLFAGDAAEAPLPYIADPLTIPELRSSLAHLLAFDAQTVLYCHAPGHDTNAVIRDNIAYFDRLEQQARAALHENRVPTMLAAATDVAALIDMPFADAPGYATGAPDEQAAFKAAHAHAARAMIAFLRAQG